MQGHGIIYTLTVRDANLVAQWLKDQGFNVEAYTSETGDRPEQLEQALLHNQVKALVATTALGMDYDKPNLAFVIHYHTKCRDQSSPTTSRLVAQDRDSTQLMGYCSVVRKSLTSTIGLSEVPFRPDRKWPRSLESA